MREESPALVLHRGARHGALFHVRHESLDVVGHQIELVLVIFVRRVHGDFGRRQREDQLARADVYVLELADVAEKRAVGFGVSAVDDGVRSHDLHESLVCSSRRFRSARPASISPKYWCSSRTSPGGWRTCISRRLHGRSLGSHVRRRPTRLARRAVRLRIGAVSFRNSANTLRNSPSTRRK